MQLDRDSPFTGAYLLEDMLSYRHLPQLGPESENPP